MSTNDTSKLPFASTNLPGKFNLKPTPVPSCLRSRVSLEKNCLRLWPAAVFVSELPTRNTRRSAARQPLSQSST